jgi:hypothetical protein
LEIGIQLENNGRYNWNLESVSGIRYGTDCTIANKVAVFCRYNRAELTLTLSDANRFNVGKESEV